MTLVFIYGTLKRGGSNHHLLAAQEFRGAARTAPGFTLYELAGYPGMVPEGGDREGVRGEVWAVSDECLRLLDELEGTAEGLYRREAAVCGPQGRGLRLPARSGRAPAGGCGLGLLAA